MVVEMSITSLLRSTLDVGCSGTLSECELTQTVSSAPLLSPLTSRCRLFYNFGHIVSFDRFILDTKKPFCL